MRHASKLISLWFLLAVSFLQVGLTNASSDPLKWSDLFASNNDRPSYRPNNSFIRALRISLVGVGNNAGFVSGPVHRNFLQSRTGAGSLLILATTEGRYEDSLEALNSRILWRIQHPRPEAFKCSPSTNKLTCCNEFPSLTCVHQILSTPSDSFLPNDFMFGLFLRDLLAIEWQNSAIDLSGDLVGKVPNDTVFIALHSPDLEEVSGVLLRLDTNHLQTSLGYLTVSYGADWRPSAFDGIQAISVQCASGSADLKIAPPLKWSLVPSNKSLKFPSTNESVPELFLAREGKKLWLALYPKSDPRSMEASQLVLDTDFLTAIASCVGSKIEQAELRAVLGEPEAARLLYLMVYAIAWSQIQ